MTLAKILTLTWPKYWLWKGSNLAKIMTSQHIYISLLFFLFLYLSLSLSLLFFFFFSLSLSLYISLSCCPLFSSLSLSLSISLYVSPPLSLYICLRWGPIQQHQKQSVRVLKPLVPRWSTSISTILRLAHSMQNLLPPPSKNVPSVTLWSVFPGNVWMRALNLAKADVAHFKSPSPSCLSGLVGTFGPPVFLGVSCRSKNERRKSNSLDLQIPDGLKNMKVLSQDKEKGCKMWKIAQKVRENIKMTLVGGEPKLHGQATM